MSPDFQQQLMELLYTPQSFINDRPPNESNGHSNTQSNAQSSQHDGDQSSQHDGDQSRIQSDVLSSHRLMNQLKAGRLSPQQQVGIYRNSMTASLANSLAETFPVCKRLMGEQCFSALAQRYIRLNPSCHPDLSTYGEHYADLLTTVGLDERIPYLNDIARLEWQWTQVFYAANECRGNLHQLQSLAQPHYNDIIFCLPAASALVQSAYPIDKIWELNLADEIDDLLLQQLNDLFDQRDRTFLFIGREGIEVKMLLLSKSEFELLQLLQTRLPFSRVMDQFMADYPNEDFELRISSLGQQGAIYRFEIR